MRKYFRSSSGPTVRASHVLSLSAQAGYTGDDTPIYERYYAGGFSSLRGFEFRGVSPRRPASTACASAATSRCSASVAVHVPDHAPTTCSAAWSSCDAGTVEPTISDWTDKFRVAPGFGLRISIPAMGPAPIALDFAFPVAKQPGDQTQIFSFFVGFNH